MHKEPLLNFIEVERPSYELPELQVPGVVIVLGVVLLATRWVGHVMVSWPFPALLGPVLSILISVLVLLATCDS